MAHTTKLILLLSVCLTFASAQALASGDTTAHHNDAKSDTAAPHWTYGGMDGPEHWGALDEAYSTCASGTQQSPIDLKEARKAPLAPVEIKWKPFLPTIINNGHTIKVDTDRQGKMILDGKTYTLLQFHFHHGSEHTINGRHYPLEAHFVHQAKDGSLGVLGVFFKEGTPNPSLQKIWNLAPLERGEMKAEKKFKPGALLPRDRGFFRYEGSLTTPPCSEIVSWVIFSQPVEASKAQIDAFAGIYAHNYRPLQSTSRRFILHSQ
ncbi:MAG: hypothetical protein COA85_13745 [Robiginitomaculum sp.]|nr:MAG: hypothetical protein COA85_13745 [Robiginitomaculum sp.]